jgi:hypothetical protein
MNKGQLLADITRFDNATLKPAVCAIPFFENCEIEFLLMPPSPFIYPKKDISMSMTKAIKKFIMIHFTRAYEISVNMITNILDTLSSKDYKELGEAYYRCAYGKILEPMEEYGKPYELKVTNLNSEAQPQKEIDFSKLYKSGFITEEEYYASVAGPSIKETVEIIAVKEQKQEFLSKY